MWKPNLFNRETRKAEIKLQPELQKKEIKEENTYKNGAKMGEKRLKTGVKKKILSF